MMMMTTTHRILVVDDDDELRESLVDVLDDNGFQTMQARNGLEALTKLRSGDDRPCLIILDLMMPVMDGESFRHEQLADPQLAAIPVVVVSAYRDALARASALRVAGFLGKPMKPEMLVDAVRQYC